MAVLSLNGRQLHGILKFDPSVTKPAVIQQQMPYPAASVSNLYPSSFAFLSFSLWPKMWLRHKRIKPLVLKAKKSFSLVGSWPRYGEGSSKPRLLKRSTDIKIVPGQACFCFPTNSNQMGVNCAQNDTRICAQLLRARAGGTILDPQHERSEAGDTERS